MTAPEDRLRSLMMRGLNGDAASHSRLLSELSVLLRGFYSRRFSGDASDAEDLVQETLIAVDTRRESYDPSKPFAQFDQGPHVRLFRDRPYGGRGTASAQTMPMDPATR